MAGFFTRLAEQALGTAPIARPVIPSVFEPLAPTPPVSGDLGAGLPAPSRAAIEPPAEPAIRHATPSTPASGEWAELPASNLSPRAASVPSREGPVAQESAISAFPKEQTKHAEHSQISAACADESPGVVPPAFNPEPTFAPAKPQVGDSIGRESFSRIVNAFALRPRNGIDGAAATPPLAEPVNSPTGLGSWYSGLARPAPVHQNTNPAPAGAPSGPTVRVTIGRVEVRAIFPERRAPQSPRAAAPPTLSLDEYLRQRRGGQR